MKQVKLIYRGKLKKVITAVNKANEILGSIEFYTQIRAYKQFNNSALSPEIISRLMQESGHEIEVKINWFMPNLKTSYDRISISAWDFSSNLGTGVNTLIFETVKAIDNLYDILHQEVGGNEADRHTAPWVIGAIAEVMVK
jgi:hypothetical protein